MKESKTFKKHQNYFKRGDTMKITAVAIMVVSLALFLFGWSYLSYIQFFVAMPAGIALLVVHFMTTAGEEDIVRYAEKATEEISLAKLEESDRKKKPATTWAPIATDGYEYPENVLVRRGKKGILRSSQYTKALLYPLDSGVGVMGTTVSVVSEQIENFSTEIPYANIRSISLAQEIHRIPVGKKSMSVTAHRLVIEYGENETLSVPMHDSVDTDAWIAKVQGLAEKSKT